MEGDTIELGGRRFAVPRHRTILNDYWVSKLVEDSLRDFQLAEGEEPEAFVQRVLTAGLERGTFFRLLGALLLPSEDSVSAWSEQMMEETERFLATCTDPADKRAIRLAFAKVLADFFELGIASLWTSATSSRSGVVEEGGPVPYPATTDVLQ